MQYQYYISTVLFQGNIDLAFGWACQALQLPKFSLQPYFVCIEGLYFELNSLQATITSCFPFFHTNLLSYIGNHSEKRFISRFSRLKYSNKLVILLQKLLLFTYKGHTIRFIDSSSYIKLIVKLLRMFSTEAIMLPTWCRLRSNRHQCSSGWRTKTSFSRTVMQALELLWLIKSHISGRSTVKQCKNQACSLSGYWVMLFWRH